SNGSFEDMLGLSDSGAALDLPAPSKTLASIPAPLVSCGNLHGYQTVLCHRVAGFVNLKLPPRQPGKPVTTNSGLNLLPGNLPSVAQWINYKSAETEQGQITNQGSVGSCSAQGAHGALQVMMAKNGDDGYKLLQLDGEKINSLFNDKQGGQATLE